jgi:glycosyltransferase involved in cell wall biosynthesis
MQKLLFSVAVLLHLIAHPRRYAVVHLHGAFFVLRTLRLIKPMLRFRVVYKATMVGLDDAVRVRDVRGAAFLAVVDCWACIAAPLAAAARKAGVARDRILQVPNGIDLDLFLPRPQQRAACRRALGLPETETIWTTIGAVVPRKGHDLLVEAWLELPTPRPWLLIVGPLESPTDGDADYVRALTTRIQELGLSGAVRLVGERSDIPELLAASDGFVFASAHEGLPNAMLEALSVGLPVVTTAFEAVEDVRTLAPGRVTVVARSAFVIAGAVRRQSTRSPANEPSAKLRALDLETVADRYASAYAELIGDAGITRRGDIVRA